MSETLHIQKSKRAWGIFYRIRVFSKSKWGSWIGPCGIYAMRFSQDEKQLLTSEMTDYLAGRPLLFRTRKQARDRAKEIDAKANLTLTWVQHTVRPIKVTYEVLK